MDFEYVATCLFGLEKLLGEEIDALGYKRTGTIDGRVTFRGDFSAAARGNLWFRTAERLFFSLGHFEVPTFTALFDHTAALPWEEFIGKNDAFPVKGHSVKSALYSIPDCQSIIKKAIATRLGKIYGQNILPETGVIKQIEFFILEDQATMMIDTSGTALHKRGYRPVSNAAPLRETLAAALVKLSRPRENVLLWDPMCGSGTIPIEAALLMTNTAPGIQRKFAAEQFPEIPSEIWKKAREEAHDLRTLHTTFEAYASDIDPECIKITQDNVRRSGMQNYINVFLQDARTISPPEGRRGTIVSNPPYGERLSTLKKAEELYVAIGKTYRALAPWQIYLLSSDEEFERFYGQRADKVRKLYNGMIKCNYYQFFKNNKK